jgi:hypothetical protein
VSRPGTVLLFDEGQAKLFVETPRDFDIHAAQHQEVHG